MTRLTRAALRGKAQTVLRLVEPSELGPTLMHEHVLCDIRPPRLRHCSQCDDKITLENHWSISYGEAVTPGNSLLDQATVAAEEMLWCRQDGGRTVVDLSCGGLRPDPNGLLAVSEHSGMHIVMGCGHYVEEYQDAENHGRTVESFACEMLDQIWAGAWGTPVRAGIVGEIGCQAPWTALEKRVMQGAAIAMGETGAALSVHPGRDPDQPQEVAEFLNACGVDMTRVVMSHIDRTIFDENRLYRLADCGCVIEFDLFGMENTYYKLDERVDMPNDGMRLRWMRKLIDRGHLEQITISHDICYRTRLRKFGGHGYGHIFRNVVPLMERRGYSKREVATILVETPRRLLTFT